MLTMILELLQAACMGICVSAMLYFFIIYIWPLLKQKTEAVAALQAQKPVDPVQALLDMTEKTQKFRLEFHRNNAQLFTRLNQEYCLDQETYNREIERIAQLYVQEYGERCALVAIEAYRIQPHQEAQFVANFLHNLSITFPALLRDSSYVASTVYQERLMKPLPSDHYEDVLPF